MRRKLENIWRYLYDERISNSKYSTNIIIKGGFLIGAIVGIDSRTTMDLDATIKALTVSKENINIEILKSAVQETAKKRETINNIKNYAEIINEVTVNENMIKVCLCS